MARKYRRKLPPVSTPSKSEPPLPSDVLFDDEASLYANWKWFKFLRDEDEPDTWWACSDFEIPQAWGWILGFFSRWFYDLFLAKTWNQARQRLSPWKSIWWKLPRAQMVTSPKIWRNTNGSPSILFPALTSFPFRDDHRVFVSWGHCLCCNQVLIVYIRCKSLDVIFLVLFRISNA